MRQAASRAAIVLALLLGTFVLWKLQLGIVLMATSLALAAAVDPLVDKLVRKRLPRFVALALVYFAGLVLLSGLLYVIGTAVVLELPRVADRSSAAWEVRAGSNALGRALSRAFAGPNGRTFAVGALGATAGVLDLILLGVIAFVLSIYLTSRRLSFGRLITIGIPDERRRAKALFVMRSIAVVVGDHLRRAIVESALGAVALAVVLWLFGVEYWATAAATAALALNVPLIGPALAVVVASLIGLSAGRGMALSAGGATLAIVIALRALLVPRLLHHRRANKLVLVMTAMVLGAAFGVVGLIIAPAASVIAAVLARRVIALRPLAEVATENHAPALPAALPPGGQENTPKAYFPVDRDRFARLEARVQRLGREVHDANPPPPEAIRDLVSRLLRVAAATTRLLPGCAGVPPPFATGEESGPETPGVAAEMPYVADVQPIAPALAVTPPERKSG